MDMKMQQKLETELARYRAELVQLNADIKLQHNKNYEQWCELLRARDSIVNAINCTEMQLVGQLRFTGVIGGLATGIKFIVKEES